MYNALAKYRKPSAIKTLMDRDKAEVNSYGSKVE